MVRGSLVLHDSGALPELAADLYHDGLGSLLHRAHVEGGEDEGEHGTDEQANQHQWIGQGQIQDLLGVALDNVHIGHQQSQRGQRGGTDGETLTGGGGGVAQRVKGFSAIADLLGQACRRRCRLRDRKRQIE